GRTDRRAAGTQYALVQTVDLLAIFRRLQTLNGRSRRVVLQVRLHLLVLVIEHGHVHHQITHHRQTRQRTQYQRLATFQHARASGRQRGDTGQTVTAVDVHTVGATHTFTAGATIGQTIILFLHQVQNVQHHQVLATGVDLVLLHVRFAVGLRVIAVNTDFHTRSPSVGADFRLEGIDGLRLE